MKNLKENPVITVSDLARMARSTVERNFQKVWVEGEISNLSKPSSGHWYFTLKDERAQVRCAMFANQNRQVKESLSNGEKILLSGKVTIYEARGDFQIIAETIQKSGTGLLQEKFDALKHQLEKEGLFSEDRKKSLPKIPKHLVIISSKSGAALQDVITVIGRRLPSLRVTLIPVSVQGDNSRVEIIQALNRCTNLGADVILLTRGGGSLEDLWTFNLEEIARAVSACPIPIVVAIGHQTDFAIAEFAADLRAPTPSAAAELITPNRLDLLARVSSLTDRIYRCWEADIRLKAEKLKRLRTQLVDPQQTLREKIQSVDVLEERLNQSTKKTIEDQQLRLATYRHALNTQRPDKIIRARQQELAHWAERLQHATKQELTRLKQHLGSSVRTLSAISPLNTIGRGYSLLSTQTGELITSTQTVSPGQSIVGHLNDGSLELMVQTISDDNRLPNIKDEKPIDN